VLNCKVNSVANEYFSVVDAGGVPISDIPIGEFTYSLFDETGALSALTVTFTNLGLGHYLAQFTPDVVGDWYLVVKHATHFPFGKADHIKASDNDFDSLAELAQAILNIEAGNWELTDTEMIFRKASDNSEIARYTIIKDVSDNPIQRIKQ
jgi:hypothetical protein